MRQDLKDRLATLNITIDDEIAQQHINTISTELRNPPVPSRSRRRRSRVAALAAATVLLALPATAVAADGAIPGELLYPVKRAVEILLSVVDPNLEAEHRIEELEIVVERDGLAVEIQQRLSDAEDAVRERDIPADLGDRLDVVRDRIRDRDPDAPASPVDSDARPPDEEPSDRPSTLR